MATLGCASSYQVLLIEEIVGMNPLTGRAAYGRPLGELADFSELVWDRRLDDVSQAVLTVPTNADCCNSLLVDAHVWHHGLAVYRDGTLVWDGPITRIETSRTEMVITASDVMALMLKRLMLRDIVFSDNATIRATANPMNNPLLLSPESPERVAATLITEALAVDSHGAFVTLLNEGPELWEALYRKWDGPIIDFVKEIADRFANWTVLGRRIVISRGGLFNGTQFARTAMLMCEDFMNEDAFRTTEDGFATLTEDVQTNEPVTIDDIPRAPTAIGVATQFHDASGAPLAPGVGVADAYYGLLAAVQRGSINIAVGGDVDPVDILAQAAANVVSGAYPPPVSLSADNLQLAPSAPVGMEELVPGTIVPILANCLCRPVSQEFLLSKLVVTVNGDGEKVEPTFISIGLDNPGSDDQGG